jgi:DNA-binding transcriptional LysR family regulator
MDNLSTYKTLLPCRDNMTDWDGLEEFTLVAETGRFSEAARRLEMSSSHVSRQIARLEERLQTRLFYRSTRTVTLTEAGKIFLPHCQHLLDARNEALKAVRDLSSEPRGLLRMTCSVAYGEDFIMPRVNEFLERYPQLRVEMTLTNQRLDLVQGSYDLAIRLGRLPDSSLVATRLAARQLYLCAAPGYIERHGAPHSLSELPRHNCLIGSDDHWSFRQNGRDLSVRVQGNWRCNSGRSVLEAALRGLGLCQLPDYYVTEHLERGTLRPLLSHLQPPDAGVWAVYPQQRNLSPKVRGVIDHLKATLAG